MASRWSYVKALAPGLVLLGAPSAWSAPSPAPLVKKLLDSEAFALSAAELLQAAATVPVEKDWNVQELMESVHLRHEPNGRTEEVYRYVFRVDREAAVQGWSLLRAGWTPWLQQQPEIRARVVTPDGAEHRLDPATLSDVPERDESQDLLQNRRQLRGPLPALKVGSVAEVEIRIQSHRSLSKLGLRRNLNLFSNVPVQATRVQLDLPGDHPFHHLLEGLPADVLQRREAQGRLRITVDQVAIRPPSPAREPYQAFNAEPWPNLAFSTVPDWASVADEYRATVEAQLRDANLDEAVKEAVGDATDRRLRIDRILAWLHKRVRYVGLEFGEASIVPRTPAETLKRGYGDCKDQAVLLTALLRRAGIPAHVALLRAGDMNDFSVKLPGLEAFNHVIVRVADPDGLWIDPSVAQAPAGLLPLADCGRKALLIAEGTREPVLIPDVTPAQNRQVDQRVVHLSDKGPARIEQTVEAVHTGDVQLRATFAGADPARLTENLRGYAKDAFKAELVGPADLTDPNDPATPFRLRLEFKEAGIAHTSDTEARVSLNPWPLVNDLNKMLEPAKNAENGEPTPETGAPTRRRTDLLLPHAWSGEMRWTLHPPLGYACEDLPARSELSIGPARLVTEWQALPNGDVQTNSTFTCAQLRWRPDEVEAARAALKTFAAEPPYLLVFTQQGEAHLAAGRTTEALREFRALAEAQPKAAGPLIRLARAQLMAGMGGQARAALAQAIALDPKNERAHRQLGWTLQHDLLGRRFFPGWDRAGAVRELRAAMALAPELRMARLDLANLMCFDDTGDWLATDQVPEAVKLYQEQVALGPDAGAQAFLTEALAHLGRFTDARASAQAMEASEARNGWCLALDTLLQGAEAAVKEARRSYQDRDVRRKAFAKGAETLKALRRYPEAGRLAQEAADGEGSEEMRKLAADCKTLRTYDSVTLDPKQPVSAVLALARLSMDLHPDPRKLFELFSPTQRPKRQDAAAAEELLRGFHTLHRASREWRLYSADRLFTLEAYGVEGSDRTGYRLTTSKSNPLPTTLYVAVRDGAPRVVGWNFCPARLAQEAAWDLDHDNLDGARAWLDRALAIVRPPEANDAFAGNTLVGLWSGGAQADAERIRVAAANVLVNFLPRQETAKSRAALEAALTRETDPARRTALLRTLLDAPLKTEEALARQRLAEVVRLNPGLPGLARFQAEVLQDLGHAQEAEDLLRQECAAHPDDVDLASRFARVLAQQGNLDEARSTVRKLVERGLARDWDYNNLAWWDVAQGKVTEQTERWAEESVQRRNTPASLHTQACVLAELGRLPEARRIHLQALAKQDGLDPSDWYLLGRMAELQGDLEEARTRYQRAVEGGKPFASLTLLDCEFLARRRLAALPHP